MSFDEIYTTAIWAAEMAEKHNVTVTKIIAFFDGISKSYTVDETKEMIERGFINE